VYASLVLGFFLLYVITHRYINAFTHLQFCAITRETLYMVNHAINFILISLLIFTPIAFASMDFWAFSLMELGILFMIILWAIQFGLIALKRRSFTSELKTPNSELDSPCFFPLPDSFPDDSPAFGSSKSFIPQKL
jgi:hypothetical protein